MYYLFILKVTNTVLVDLNNNETGYWLILYLQMNLVFVFILLTTSIMVIYGVKSFKKMKN